jgi:uncharacterized protein YbjT (DUF2867 family)
MKVFVTGGTGFVGREIVRQLREAGHHVRLLVRNANPAVLRLVEQYRVEVRQGNVLDATGLPETMQGMEAVIHLVGIIREIGEQTFENVHTRATQNVVQSALIAGARRFVHMSALGTRANAVSRYHQTKWAAEQAVSQSLLDWTIFRPSLIYGPQDEFVNLFAQMAKWSPVLPVMARKDVTFQPVAVEDVAHCFVGALTEPRSVRYVFDVCGPDRLTLTEILSAILKATNRKCLLVPVPVGLSRPMAGLLEFIYPKLLKKPTPLNRDQVQMLQENNVGETKWTTELFELEPVSFKDGIERYLKRDPV